MLRQYIISFQEGSELVADHSLNKFRHVGEIGNWPVVLDIVLIQSLLLDDWFYNGMSLRDWQPSLLQRTVAHLCHKWEQLLQKFFKDRLVCMFTTHERIAAQASSGTYRWRCTWAEFIFWCNWK